MAMKYVKVIDGIKVLLHDTIMIDGRLLNVGEYDYIRYAETNGFTLKEVGDDIPLPDPEQVALMTDDEKNEVLANIVKHISK